MELLDKKEVASVKIFSVEVTEDELDVYGKCMKYVLDNVPSDKIEEICGAYDDELLSMYEDISNLLDRYSNLR